MSYKILLLFSSIILFSCSKTKNTWLVGTWEVKQYLINGNDSTSVFLNDPCHKPLVFLPEDNNPNFFSGSYGGCAVIANYELSDDNNQIKIGFFDYEWKLIGNFGRRDILQYYKCTFMSANYNKILLQFSRDSIYEKIILIKIKK